MNKIVFLLYGEDSPFEGVVRPFINWAKVLSRNHEVSIVLVKCGKNLISFVKALNNVESKFFNNMNEIIQYLSLVKPNILFTDDYIPRLKLIQKIKREVKIKTAIYVQILFGIHSIVDAFDLSYSPIKEKVIFKLVKLIPFSLFQKIYKKLLLQNELIVANSDTTTTLLQILYGTEVDEVVYPPVDTKVFKPSNAKKKNQILLYLGSHGGDTDESFVREICKLIKVKDFKIFVMGNPILKERLQKQFEIHSISGLSDVELSNIYSQSKLTICPQKWEMFGYVPVESIACGTPVLAFNCMGLRESIINEKTGWLVNNKQKFLETLNFLLDREKIQMDQKFIRRYVEKKFSITASIKRLDKILR